MADMRRVGLLGLGLLGLSAQPSGAQGWPGASGPSGDLLRSTLQQYDRLAPPPVEALPRAERAVPNIPASDLSRSGPGETGLPSTALPPQRAERRETHRPVSPARRVPSREALLRALADHDRRIRDLEQRLDEERRRSRSASISGGSQGVDAVPAATVPPR